jgi:hypothetical protein
MLDFIFDWPSGPKRTVSICAETLDYAVVSALNSIAGSLRPVDGKYGESLCSGCWSHVHVEGEGLRVGVAVRGRIQLEPVRSIV